MLLTTAFQLVMTTATAWKPTPSWLLLSLLLGVLLTFGMQLILLLLRSLDSEKNARLLDAIRNIEARLDERREDEIRWRAQIEADVRDLRSNFQHLDRAIARLVREEKP